VDARRARRVKIGLAGLAVLGVGAALTSAVWTDVVFFDAEVTTGNFNLQGALPADQAAPAVPTDPAAWEESDDIAAITLNFGSVQVAPEESTVLTGYVRNDTASTWTADLTAIGLDPTSTLPAGITAVPVFTDPVPPDGLAPGDVATFTLTVAADDTVVEGATGTIIVRVDGESVDPVPAP
jgi:predicted ribosomally synthesized peptide with SipW-like signal peptide